MLSAANDCGALSSLLSFCLSVWWLVASVFIGWVGSACVKKASAWQSLKASGCLLFFVTVTNGGTDGQLLSNVLHTRPICTQAEALEAIAMRTF